LENLSKNRAKKHRRRARSLHLNQHFWAASEPSVAHNRAVAIEAIERIKENTTTDEWKALSALSNGESYAVVAAEHQCSESAVKTRISRCRKRLAMLCA
jgi:DNA-directed RNA polymerase specialized sigma24 family protein